MTGYLCRLKQQDQQTTRTGRMKVWAVLLLNLCCVVFGEETYSSSFTNRLTLDPHEKFNASWTVEQDSITFTVTCETTGWVGLGFSPSGSMTDADIVVAWVADDGSSYLLDMYATANTVPTEDTTQDVTLLSASEASGITTVTFKRKLDTCDEDEDNVITSSTTRLIYAYQLSDPDNNIYSGADYHGAINRGSKNIYLLDSKTPRQTAPLPEDARTFDITVNNYNLPAFDTIYYCAFQAPPDLDDVHHVIAIEPLITEGNEGIVHHILLYACYGLSEEQINNNSKTEGQCESPEMPEFGSYCGTTMHGWAVGGGSTFYPEEVGYSIGGRNGSSPSYFQIEIHYDNPGLSDTFVDSSGFRLIYTSTLRDYEAGILPVGLVQGIAIPPGVDNFRSVAYCDGSCTNDWIPEEGVTIIGFLLHTHLLGRAVHLEWYRNGQNMGLLAFDDSYDFNFQETRLLDQPHKLLPGDSLKVTCFYSSDTRDSVTYGGDGTSEEMCLAYLSYYPRQDLSHCTSVPELYFSPIDPVYSALNLTLSPFEAISVLSEVPDWTDELVTILQDGFDQTSYYSACERQNGVNYNASNQVINTSDFPVREKKEEEPCVKDMMEGGNHTALNDSIAMDGNHTAPNDPIVKDDNHTTPNGPIAKHDDHANQKPEDDNSVPPYNPENKETVKKTGRQTESSANVIAPCYFSFVALAIGMMY